MNNEAMMKRQNDTIPTPVKLSALWAATMFCYVYGDYFGLYVDGKIEAVSQGSMGPLGPATPGVLVAVSLMMAIPACMVALSVLLPPTVSRWSNIILGIAYTGIMALTIQGSQPFYFTLAIIEMILTFSIAVVAWTWPRAK